MYSSANNNDDLEQQDVQFNQLNKELNTSFEKDYENKAKETKNTNKEIISQKNNQLSKQNFNFHEKSHIDQYLQRQEYIKIQLDTAISDTIEVMQNMKNDLKPGSKASQFEAYSKIISSTKELFESYKDLNEQIKNTKEIEYNGSEEQKQQERSKEESVKMTGDQLVDLVIQAQKTQEVKEEDVQDGEITSSNNDNG